MAAAGSTLSAAVAATPWRSTATSSGSSQQGKVTDSRSLASPTLTSSGSPWFAVPDGGAEGVGAGCSGWAGKGSRGATGRGAGVCGRGGVCAFGFVPLAAGARGTVTGGFLGPQPSTGRTRRAAAASRSCGLKRSAPRGCGGSRTAGLTAHRLAAHQGHQGAGEEGRQQGFRQALQEEEQEADQRARSRRAGEQGVGRSRQRHEEGGEREAGQGEQEDEGGHRAQTAAEHPEPAPPGGPHARALARQVGQGEVEAETGGQRQEADRQRAAEDDADRGRAPPLPASHQRQPQPEQDHAGQSEKEQAEHGDAAEVAPDVAPPPAAEVTQGEGAEEVARPAGAGEGLAVGRGEHAVGPGLEEAEDEERRESDREQGGEGQQQRRRELLQRRSQLPSPRADPRLARIRLTPRISRERKVPKAISAVTANACSDWRSTSSQLADRSSATAQAAEGGEPHRRCAPWTACSRRKSSTASSTTGWAIREGG